MYWPDNNQCIIYWIKSDKVECVCSLYVKYVSLQRRFQVLQRILKFE